MKKISVILFLVFTVTINSQSNFKSFFELSGPKKMWVLFHPFKATKALKISQQANRVADSIKKTNLLDGDAAGGQVDAFRHAYWMARLHQEIGESAARSLGKAHEKENYSTFKKLKLEDGVVPDEISSKMDLFNNEQGLKLIFKGSKVSNNGLIYRVVNAILKGKMKIIQKDKKGYFLTCDGILISKESLIGKWKNNKCLVNSNLKKE
ncbi:DUF6973 domain-containing protein [Polaribacter glomeratus]|uniref:DUF6973 domain-containing protein n=1 Tax=Polaribacter glomeratus TaxID=102 RepID=A0A2S7WGG3_9FLAO|nr:hypothetical protein [Polaribacter glomeratus]PQJ76703.1 hypothetical protein BTO16_12530 [Polaribacter glomeratus]TXD67455.1 hypothetical protein ESX12_02385 [Polaribacter glomeratus]